MLINHLESSEDTEFREMCVDMIVELLREDDLITWSNLSASTQSTVKTFLLNSIMVEESGFVVLKLGSIVLKLATSFIKDNNWPELVPFLYQCLDSSSKKYAKASAFLTLAGLAEKVGETIVHSMKGLHSIFRDTLNDDKLDLEVRSVAMYAAINFIQCLSSSNEKERFQDLLPCMMKTLNDALSSGNEEFILRNQYPMRYFMMLANEPRFLRRQLVDVVCTVFEIVEAECLEEDTRHMAVEFLITLVEAKEKAPGMMKKLPLFIGRCFAMLLKLLLDIKDESDWHSAEDVFDDSGTTRIFHVGSGCLSRFSLAIGGKSIAHISIEQLSAYLDSPEWEKRHAALFALSRINKSCSKVITTKLDEVVSMVVNCFQDFHPRVRWAACRASIWLLLDFSPHLHEQYRYQIFLALAAAVEDFHPRVQAYATRALGAFCLSNKLETLIPLLDGIVNKTLVLIQNEKQMVQLEALRALSATAQTVEEHFRTYYDTVMPHLKAILRDAHLKSDLILRARAMECISIVGKAVGKEKFRDDGKQVMEAVVSFQGLQAKADDPSTWDMLTAFAVICECIGQELLTYISAAMPFLIQCVKLHFESNELDDTSIETIKIGDEILWKKDDDPKEKAKACEMLCMYAKLLKEDFYPWISQVVPILVPLRQIYMHNPDKKSDVSEVMAALLLSAKLAVEKGIAEGAYFKELSDYVILALIEALHKEHVAEICQIMLKELKNCLLICGPLIDEGQLHQIVDELKHVIKESLNRKRKLTERTKSEDFDDEEAKVLADEEAQEDLIIARVGTTLKTLIGTFKAAFVPFLDELLSYLIPMWGNDKPTVRFTSIYIFVSLVEECPEAALKYCDVFLPLLLDETIDEDPMVRQYALYGVCLYAESGDSVFKPFVREALSRINVVLMHFRAHEPVNEEAYDKAVSALCKICLLHRESIDSAQVIPIWLNCLPIKADLHEAKYVHDELCSMVERLDRDIIGHNYQYLPKIVSVFAEVVFSDEKDVSTEETANRMISVLRHLQQTLPPATMESAWSYLLPHQEMTLKSLLSPEV
ncbi:hypothetical protein P3S68_033667 [Capsicum galapagoense]